MFTPTPLSLIFLFTAVANGFLAFIMYRRKKIPGINYFSLFAISFGIWSFSVFLELAVIDVSWKIFFSKCSYFGVTTAVLFQFLFGLRFAGIETRESVRKWHALFLVSAFFIILGFTNEQHYLQWTAYEKRITDFGTFVSYKPGIGVWLLAFFMWGLFLAGMRLISKRLMIGHALYRKRYFSLLVVFIIPLLGNVFYMFKLLPFPEIDWTPQLFFISFSSLYLIMRKNQMMETLPESRESTFQAMQNPVLVTNSDNVLVDFNPAAAKIWPQIEHELSHSILKIMPETEAIVSEKESQIEAEISRNGNSRWYEISTASIESDLNEKKGLLYLFNDITEARKTRVQLEESERELRALNVAKDRFFSIIGHDLRSPFAVISGLSAHLRMDLQSQTNESLADKLLLIEQSTQKTLDLLENLLTWARLQADGMKAEKRIVDLAKLIKNVISVLEGAATRKNIRLIYSVNVSTISFVDENMILTVLRNLVSNAIKYSELGSSILITATSNDEHCMIEVQDNGRGIPSEMMDNLFKLAEETVSVGTAGESGTGLGLLLCKDFVEKNNGTIRAESKPGEGTSFIFSLPAN